MYKIKGTEAYRTETDATSFQPNCSKAVSGDLTGFSELIIPQSIIFRWAALSKSLASPTVVFNDTHTYWRVYLERYKRIPCKEWLCFSIKCRICMKCMLQYILVLYPIYIQIKYRHFNESSFSFSIANR